MNMDSTLEKFLDSQLFDEDYGTFSITLPINVSSHVEFKAREYAGINRMVSTDDVIKSWGSTEAFHIWKDSVVKDAKELNFNYLLGMVEGLNSFYNQYQLKVNGLDVDDLERIDTKEYVNNVLFRAFITDSE